jgi:hypothetical protein
LVRKLQYYFDKLDGILLRMVFQVRMTIPRFLVARCRMEKNPFKQKSLMFFS